MVRVQAFLFVGLNVFFQLTECFVYPTIHWAPDNPLFERNDSLIYVFPSSKLSIVCPNPSTVMKTARDSISKNELYQNFWIVSRDSYERCDTSQGSRLLLKCNEPLRLNYFTLVFQEYSAVNHPVYIPGEEYYFIATSDGTLRSVGWRSGGNCKHANMRLKIHVCIDFEDPNCIARATATTGKITTKTMPTTKASTETRRTRKASQSIILSTTASSVTPQKTTATTHASRFSTSLLRSSVVARTTKQDTQGPVARASSDDQHQKNLIEAVTGLNWMVVIPLMACLLLSLLGNIILICRLKIRDHGYQLPHKDQEMIQTVKRSVALTEETQVEKALLFKVTGEATKV
ncbi:uncharacterized protein LOC141863952 [Acropora palmata]|uniref:uncharacterized protein LOC141863952 n=1 Tax=Acropora palmata TaxID=6131 RepID=UPI003DA1008D